MRSHRTGALGARTSPHPEPAPLWQRRLLVRSGPAGGRAPSATRPALNVRAPLLLIAALVPAMSEHGGGSIINLSSLSGLVGPPRRAAYAASKGGMDAATRSMAIELGPLGIR